MDTPKQKFQKLTAALPVLVVIYCVLQPLLDVASYWTQTLGVTNTPIVVLRSLLLFGSVFLGFLLSDRKRFYFLAALAMGLLTAGHVLACLKLGYEGAISDLTNLLRIYLMPLTVLCFISFLRRSDKVFSAMKLGMVLNLGIIALVQLVSTVTGTDPHTYPGDVGVLGWFLWGNDQSAILSMLVPVGICWFVTKWKGKVILPALLTVAAQATLYFFGTRLSFACMTAVGVAVAVCLLIMKRGCWKQALAVLLITLVFTACYPFSATHARLRSVSAREDENQARIKELNIQVQDLPKEEKEKMTEEERIQMMEALLQDPLERRKIERLYRAYVYGTVQRFGIDRTFRAYDYALEAKPLGSNRKAKLIFCKMLMEDAPVLSHLFGLNLSSMKEFVKNYFYNWNDGHRYDGYLIYDVENDFHGIYYLTGWVGLAMMAAMLLYFGLRALWRIIRDFKTYFTPDMVGFAGAYVCAMIYAYWTVTVLRRNNASVYLALVLAGLWYLSRREWSAKEMERHRLRRGTGAGKERENGDGTVQDAAD